MPVSTWKVCTAPQFASLPVVSMSVPYLLYFKTCTTHILLGMHPLRTSSDNKIENRICQITRLKIEYVPSALQILRTSSDTQAIDYSWASLDTFHTAQTLSARIQDVDVILI